MHGLSQWHTRLDFLVVLFHSHFIFGQTNFIVGSPQRRRDLLPSRFIGRRGSCGQQGMPLSLTVLSTSSIFLHLQGFYLHQENRLFFYNDFGVGCKKVFVVKAYISDDTKSVCYNAKFIGVTEMSVHIHLPNGRICGSMRRHGAIGCFVRVVGIIQSFCLFKCFELLYDTVGLFRVIFSNPCFDA